MFNIDTLFSEDYDEAKHQHAYVARGIRNRPRFKVSKYRTDGAISDLAPELQDLYARVKAKHPKVLPLYSEGWEGTVASRALALYFEGHDIASVLITRHDTRRSDKPGYEVEMFVSHETRPGHIYTTITKSVDIKKLARFINKQIAALPNDALHLGVIDYARDEPSIELQKYIREKQRLLRNITVDELLPTIRWLKAQGIELPDANLRQRFEQILESDDALQAVAETHGRMIAVRNMGDGRIMVAGADKMLQNGRVLNHQILTQDQIPDWVVMRVSTVAMCKDGQMVEGVGYRHDKDTFFIVCGDFDE